ncbi:MAG TPA: alpha-ketoglutarate-dependent dioxygenase AlkB [Tepidisphaeraceae bacterium]|nr:alpha-ketoglutarate-dependent dioxygenase AlkB [Tepidisphaeraceae bacterium]
MKRQSDQPGLFDTGSVQLPEGFKYQPDLITVNEERELVRQIAPLPFADFEFQGFTGKRRVVSFGWRYDFNERELQKVDDMPPFLMSLRERAARFAQLPPDGLQHVLVTAYGPGAAIGWHRDKAVFAEVVGISLLAPCPFRLRRKFADKWQRMTIAVEPRSAYLLAGPSRTEWEHSIPPMDRLRYSITFRNFR